MKAGIIAAGDGSRLAQAGIAQVKPLVEIGGMTLLERTMRILARQGIAEIALIVNETMPQVARYARQLNLPVPVRTVIKTTESSMHSLYHLEEFLAEDRFVLCTVDTVVMPDEFGQFIKYFADNAELELLLSCTDFVDDEKPLYISLGPEDRVMGLGALAEGSPFVTAGIYGMSPGVFGVLAEAQAQGMMRLRNFLQRLLDRGFLARGFRFSKAVDVDRPEDIQVAEQFLLEARPCS
jgi:NDP-sugar pyrophosphorylase family protein